MRVLIIDHGWAQASYLSAILAACGEEVVLVTTHPLSGLPFGRGTRVLHSDVSTVEGLEQVIRQNPADLIYLMTESLMTLAEALPADLAQNIFPKLTDAQRDALVDRRALYALLHGSGVEFPATLDVERDEDLDRGVQQFGFPMVVRGTAGCAGIQVRIVDSAESLADAVAQIRRSSPDGVFLQRFVPGRRCIVGALCIDGEVQQIITQRVLETFPHSTSPSIVNRSFHSERLVAKAEAVFRLLKWTGFTSADFIEDDHGDFHFLEMNPRLWGSVQVAEVCGVPMLDAFARLISGRVQLKRRTARPDRQVVLFPQYLLARHAQGRLWRVGEIVPVLRCLVDAPPGLGRYLIAYLRRSSARVGKAVGKRFCWDRQHAQSEAQTVTRCK